MDLRIWTRHRRKALDWNVNNFWTFPFFNFEPFNFFPEYFCWQSHSAEFCDNFFSSVFAKLRIFPEWRSCCEIKLKTFLNNCVSVKSFDSQKKSLLGGKNRRLKCKPFLTSCIRFHTVNNCPLKWSMTGFEPGTSAVRNLCYNHRHNWKDLVRMSSQVIAVLRIWKHCFLITERILIADKSVPNCQFLCTK